MSKSFFRNSELCFLSLFVATHLMAIPSSRRPAPATSGQREVQDTQSTPIDRSATTTSPVVTNPPASSTDTSSVRIPAPPVPSAPSEPPARVMPPPVAAMPGSQSPHTGGPAGSQPPALKKSPAEIEEPRRIVATPVVDTKSDPRVVFAERLADLLVCVPSHKDADYSTLSWYVTESFKSWNNDAVDGSFTVNPSDPAFRDVFESSVMARVASRNVNLAKDPVLVDFVKNASLAAKDIYSQAVQEKQKKDFSTTVPLLKASSRVGTKNIYENLKTLHSKNVASLKGVACAPLAKRFFETPKFTGTAQMIAASPVIKGGRKVSERPESLKRVLAEVDKRNARDAAIDSKFPKNEAVTTQLPFVRYEDRKAAGYYSAGKYQWARPHIVGNILKAADTLKAQGISIGVGDINAQGNETQKKVPTPGYRGRDNGTKATFLLVNPKGEASSCGFDSQTCYDPEKSFQMVKALIDSDPENIRRIEIANDALREKVEEYLVSAHRFKKISANWVVRTNKEFTNAINFEWRK